MADTTDSSASDGASDNDEVVTVTAVVGEPSAPEPATPARPVVEWTPPSASRDTTPPVAAAANPLQVWATLAGNLFALQRKTWADLAGFSGTRNPQDR